MTCHAFGSTWTTDEPVTDSLVEQIAYCVNNNRLFNQSMGFTAFCPTAFAIFNAADHVVYHMGRMLDAWRKEGDFAAFASAKIPDEHRWLSDLMIKVFPLIDFPKEHWPVGEDEEDDDE